MYNYATAFPTLGMISYPQPALPVYNANLVVASRFSLPASDWPRRPAPAGCSVGLFRRAAPSGCSVGTMAVGSCVDSNTLCPLWASMSACGTISTAQLCAKYVTP